MTLLAVALIVVVLVVALAVIVSRRSASSIRSRPGTTQPSMDFLRGRLGRTRENLVAKLDRLPGRQSVDPAFWSELEDALIGADMGVVAAAKAVAEVRLTRPGDAASAVECLQNVLTDLLAGRDRALNLVGSPAVVLVVGVNGAGKTTTIAKLAARLKSDGRSVLLGAADTYRAGADAQLRTWGDRMGVEVVGGAAASDPAAVAHNAYKTAAEKGVDVVIIDTAGRLQSKSNLMDELGKVARVVLKAAGNLDEVLLVLDGASGQNALSQSRAFCEAVGVTGLVVTKLDGSARGGVTIAIEQELEVPVKFIGLGEEVDQLVAFDPVAFVEALVGS